MVAFAEPLQPLSPADEKRATERYEQLDADVERIVD